MPTILRAARANLLLTPTGTALAVIASILVVRWLGPETYADYATLLALLSWLLLLAESGCNVGLGRFLSEAEAVDARGSLYWKLQFRRWGLALILTLLLVWLGPHWAKASGLPSERWSSTSFALIGLLAAVMLHGQLASSAMLTSFRHGRLLLMGQSMTIVRALMLGLLAGIIREPLALVSALLALAVIEAVVLHYTATAAFRKERTRLPSGMANAAQAHGLVALFDKLTTALSGGPFLLLVLAGIHGRVELAILAVATDLLQKALSVIGLPISNLVLPMLNASRGDDARYRHQIARLGGLVTTLFAVAVGGIATAIPLGLPLLLGPSYSATVPVAMIWLLPLFFESGVRMIWGVVLLTLGQYRWLMVFNLIYGAISLMIIFFMRDMASLTTLLLSLGILRIFMSLILLGRSARLKMLPPASRPVGIILAAGVACVFALGVQALLATGYPMLQLSIGVGVYAVVMLTFLRWLPLIPQPSYEALCQIAGKYRNLLVHIIPQSVKESRSA
ncbi:MAG: hypothetical protein A2512_10575 [Deltaproteobacteria bacterium RIFOXYD12_FULL_56_24]|nr:MAG: hypothetical protein A2512_10575 [Deltaproteobacteria bacterium RIFOXYD12_FULL_56_24]